jgi:hypothetical protein
MRDNRNNAMRTVNVNKETLLKTVRENKEKHIKAYQEGLADYGVVIKKVAEKNVERAKSFDGKEAVQFRSYPSFPLSYEKEYDRAIAMLEFSVDTTIELEQQIFNQLVLDEWQWKMSFDATNSSYKSML